MKEQTSESYCQAMTLLGTYHAKALTSLVMSLASFEDAHSVVGLSQSPLFHHQYSSIADAIHGVCHKESDYESISKLIRHFCMGYYPMPIDYIYRFNSDSSTILKLFSPTLKDRSQVHIPNTVIAGNKPLSVGYRTSAITLSEDDGWQLPLTVKRISLDQTATECLIGQLSTLFEDKLLPFQVADLVINRLDRGFGNAQYLSPSYQYSNLVSVVRLRQGQKIYLPASESNSERPPGGGRPNIYEKTPRYLYPKSQTKTIKYKNTLRDVFQSSIFEISPTQVQQVETITKKGKKITHTITQWDNLLLRTKKGKKMSDKLLNLLAVVSIETESGKNVFKQPLFIVISGKNKDQLSSEEAFCEYLQRYDIEPFFRFNKQKLLLDKFQTPDVQHLDNWILVIQLAIFLLFLTAQEAQHTCPKWQKYLPIEKEPSKIRLTIAQARKAAQTLFLTFDKNPFLPVKSKKGKPREKGQEQTKRTLYEVVRKKKKPPI